MRVTVLDDYIMVATMNQEVMPIYKHMFKVIEETLPVAHLWEPADGLVTPLPLTGVKWPDSAMCLWIPRGLAPGHHRFCVDVDYLDGEFKPWFDKTRWDLEGAFVFQQGPDSFDVIPVARESQRRTIIQTEVQIHYELTDTGWVWQRAITGPANPLFHDYFIAQMEPEDRLLVDDAVAHMGDMWNYGLGTYWQMLQQPGQWHIHPAKEAKMKIGKDGKVKKIYRPASAGYKQYVVTGAAGTTPVL